MTTQILLSSILMQIWGPMNEAASVCACMLPSYLAVTTLHRLHIPLLHHCTQTLLTPVSQMSSSTTSPDLCNQVKVKFVTTLHRFIIPLLHNFMETPSTLVSQTSSIVTSLQPMQPPQLGQGQLGLLGPDQAMCDII